MSSTALWPLVSFLRKIRKPGEVGRVQTLKSDLGSVIIFTQLTSSGTSLSPCVLIWISQLPAGTSCPLGESDQVGVNQCVSLNPTHNPWGFLRIATPEPIIHLAPIVSYCVLFSPFIRLQVKLCHLASVHQRIHSHWVSSYFTAGLGVARTGGTGQWARRHCLFHLCSDLCPPSPLFHPSHRPPKTTNIFHVTLPKNLALLCSCSTLSLSSAQDACSTKGLPVASSEGSLGDLFHYLFKIVIAYFAPFQDLFEF